MFLQTFDIGKKLVANCVKKLTKRQGLLKKTSGPQVINSLKKHINSFPVMESNDTREKSQRK